jgi:multiple sugar transport system permease protein
MLILPTLVVMAPFSILPLVEGFRLSFTNANLLDTASRYVGVANYARLLPDPVFWESLWHSLVLTSAAVVLQLVLGFVLALALKQDVPGIRFVRSVIMASWSIPVAATAVMFTFMVQPGYGYVNILLRLAGIRANAFWFGDLTFAFPFMVLLHLWRNVPFYAIALLAAMQAIPASLYEAAEMDGAGPPPPLLPHHGARLRRHDHRDGHHPRAVDLQQFRYGVPHHRRRPRLPRSCPSTSTGSPGSATPSATLRASAR